MDFPTLTTHKLYGVQVTKTKNGWLHWTLGTKTLSARNLESLTQKVEKLVKQNPSPALGR